MHWLDEQVGKIVEAIELPDCWLDEVLRRINLKDEVERVRSERLRVQDRLRRLGKAYIDALVSDEDYSRRKTLYKMELGLLVVP